MRIREGIARQLTPGLGLVVALMAVAILAPPATTAKDRDGGDRWATRSGEDFEWRGPIASGKAIEIKGVNGGIVAEPTTGTEVEVVAHKTARKSDPDEVRVEVIEHQDGVTLCAVYPTPRGDRPNTCEPGEGGRMNTRDNDVQVAFTVRVPAGVAFIGRTVNGAIEARGLKSDAEAHTVNGSVRVSTRGTAQASTVNGSIEAEMGSAIREPLEFTTVNGGITLRVPAGSGADLRASTVNGDISTDFPLTVRGKFSHHRITGTIGKGGPQLVMTTVNGSIRLRESL
jgi:hypothetical protein